MSEDSNSGNPVHGPRYWYAKAGCVVPGVPEALLSDILLKDIIGRYRWVWEDHVGDEWTYHEMDDDKKRSGLQIESMKPGSEEMSQLKGRFDMAGWHLNFTGLLHIGRDKWHVWEVLNVDREDDYTLQSLDEEGNYISILNVKDDEGYPFVMFTWYSGWITCQPECSFLVGKRYTEQSSWKELSDGERFRLGMKVDEAELKMRAEVGKDIMPAK